MHNPADCSSDMDLSGADCGSASKRKVHFKKETLYKLVARIENIKLKHRCVEDTVWVVSVHD